jgi:hypothetical protein
MAGHRACPDGGDSSFPWMCWPSVGIVTWIMPGAATSRAPGHSAHCQHLSPTALRHIPLRLESSPPAKDHQPDDVASQLLPTEQERRSPSRRGSTRTLVRRATRAARHPASSWRGRRVGSSDFGTGACPDEGLEQPSPRRQKSRAPRSALQTKETGAPDHRVRARVTKLPETILLPFRALWVYHVCGARPSSMVCATRSRSVSARMEARTIAGWAGIPPRCGAAGEAGGSGAGQFDGHGPRDGARVQMIALVDVTSPTVTSRLAAEAGTADTRSQPSSAVDAPTPRARARIRDACAPPRPRGISACGR